MFIDLLHRESLKETTDNGDNRWKKEFGYYNNASFDYCTLLESTTLFVLVIFSLSCLFSSVDFDSFKKSKINANLMSNQKKKSYFLCWQSLSYAC